MTPAERQDKIARMKSLNPDITQRELAERLGVTPKTIQRDIEVLDAQGLVPAKQVVMTQAERDQLWESDDSTFRMIDEAIRRTNEAQAALHKELGFESEECECCGRKGLRFDKNSAMLHSAYYSGGAALNNQIVTRAKLRGEMAENYIITVSQIDADAEAIMASLSNMDSVVASKATINPDGSINVRGVVQALVFQVHNSLTERSVRRRKRLAPAVDIIDNPEHYLKD